MPTTPRLRRSGIAALAALTMVLSPVVFVQSATIATAEESADNDSLPSSTTMKVVEDSKTLEDKVRADDPGVFKLSDGSFFVISNGGWGDAGYQVLNSNLEEVAGAKGEADINLKTFAVNGDTYYDTEQYSPVLRSHKLSSAGVTETKTLATFGTDDSVTGIALSHDKSELGVVVKTSTGSFTNPTVTAKFLTFELDGTKKAEVDLPTPEELYPNADNSRGDVWSGSTVNSLRSLSDGSWLFYGKANVTTLSGSDEVPIPNPPIHITPSASPTAALFTGADDDFINKKRALNGFDVINGGTQVVAWDAGSDPRKPHLYVFNINDGALTKVFGGQNDDVAGMLGFAQVGADYFVYTAGEGTSKVLKMDSTGAVTDTLNLDSLSESVGASYGNAISVDNSDLIVFGAKKIGGYKVWARVLRVSTAMIADEYNFRYTFADSTGGYAKPGDSAVKKPAFEKVGTYTTMPAPPTSEIQGYAFDGVNPDDATIDATTGYVTFSPKNTDAIADKCEKVARLTFPVKVTYTDDSTDKADAVFHVERPEDEVDRSCYDDNEKWSINYNGGQATDARVGVPVSVKPEADDSLKGGYAAEDVPEGTTFSLYPADDEDHKTPEGVELAEDGTITYTAPESAAETNPVTVPVKVIYEDGTTDDTSAFFKVGPKPTQGTDNASYGVNKAVKGEETKVTPTFPFTDGGQRPDNAYFALKDPAPEGMSINHETGEITFTPTTTGEINGYMVMYYGDNKFAESGYSFSVKEADPESTTTAPTTTAPTTTSTEPTTESTTATTEPTTESTTATTEPTTESTTATTEPTTTSKKSSTTAPTTSSKKKSSTSKSSTSTPATTLNPEPTTVDSPSTTSAPSTSAAPTTVSSASTPSTTEQIILDPGKSSTTKSPEPKTEPEENDGFLSQLLSIGGVLMVILAIIGWAVASAPAGLLPALPFLPK